MSKIGRAAYVKRGKRHRNRHVIGYSVVRYQDQAIWSLMRRGQTIKIPLTVAPGHTLMVEHCMCDPLTAFRMVATKGISPEMKRRFLSPLRPDVLKFGDSMRFAPIDRETGKAVDCLRNDGMTSPPVLVYSSFADLPDDELREWFRLNGDRLYKHFSELPPDAAVETTIYPRQHKPI